MKAFNTLLVWKPERKRLEIWRWSWADNKLVLKVTTGCDSVDRVHLASDRVKGWFVNTMISLNVPQEADISRPADSDDWWRRVLMIVVVIFMCWTIVWAQFQIKVGSCKVRGSHCIKCKVLRNGTWRRTAWTVCTKFGSVNLQDRGRKLLAKWMTVHQRTRPWHDSGG